MMICNTKPMILTCYNKALVHLADTSVCWWPDPSADIAPITKVTGAVAVCACKRSGLHAVLTHDGRILVGLKPEYPLTDITPSAHPSLSTELLEEGVEIHVYRAIITVKTLNSISFIYTMLSRSYNKPVIMCASTFDTFPYEINLSSFAASHGLIRTANNSMILVDTDHNLDSSIRPIDICDAENIQEIICADGFTLLIMKNGAVRACGLFSSLHSSHSWFPSTDNPFVQIEFPDGVTVAKIVTDGLQIFYITTTGQCYYHNARAPTEGRPVIVQSFTDYYVENVFITNDFVIIQHDGNKLRYTYLRDTHRDYGTRMSPSDINGTGGRQRPDGTYEKGFSPEALPSFDNKGIVAVDEVHGWLYFTTSEGRVYYHTARDLICQYPRIREIQLFVDSPVMIECGAARIQSATSALNDA